MSQTFFQQDNACPHTMNTIPDMFMNISVHFNVAGKSLCTGVPETPDGF